MIKTFNGSPMDNEDKINEFILMRNLIDIKVVEFTDYYSDGKFCQKVMETILIYSDLK